MHVNAYRLLVSNFLHEIRMKEIMADVFIQNNVLNLLQ